MVGQITQEKISFYGTINIYVNMFMTDVKKTMTEMVKVT